MVVVIVVVVVVKTQRENDIEGANGGRKGQRTKRGLEGASKDDGDGIKDVIFLSFRPSIYLFIVTDAVVQRSPTVLSVCALNSSPPQVC